MHEVTLINNLIQIKPSTNMNSLLSDLIYTHRGMFRGAFTFEQRKLYEIHDDVLYLSIGFLSRVKSWFKSTKTPYSLRNKREVKWPDARYDQVIELREGQAELLASIAISNGGVIDSPTAFGKSLIVVEVCKMYPTLRIVVVSTAKSVVNTLYDRLAAVMPSSQLGKLGDGHNDIKRITVSTAKSLTKIDPTKVDLLLFDEAHQAAAPSISAVLAHFYSARMFGLTASKEGRSDGADMMLEAIFGPVRYTKTYAEAVKSGNITQLHVHVYKVPGNKSYSSMQERNSLGIWSNSVRNGLIADVVSKPEYEGKQVLIIVSKTEHLFHLARMLPDFELAYDSLAPKTKKRLIKLGVIQHDFVAARPKETKELAKRFETQQAMKVISTGIWDTGVDFPHLEVCVRAAGGSSAIASVQTPGRLSRKSDKKDIGILIDFFDAFDYTTKRNSNTRLLAYKKLGWIIHKHYTG